MKKDIKKDDNSEIKLQWVLDNIETNDLVMMLTLTVIELSKLSSGKTLEIVNKILEKTIIKGKLH